MSEIKGDNDDPQSREAGKGHHGPLTAAPLIAVTSDGEAAHDQGVLTNLLCSIAKRASRYDVRIGEVRGHGKADRQWGGGQKNPNILRSADIISGSPLRFRTIMFSEPVSNYLGNVVSSDKRRGVVCGVVSPASAAKSILIFRANVQGGQCGHGLLTIFC